MPVVLKPSQFAARLAAGDNPAVIFGGRQARLAASYGETAIAADDRAIDFAISTAGVARDGMTIAPAGWQLEAFKKNPVVLWAHDDGIPAIGRAINTRVAGGVLRSTGIFATRDVHPLADTVYQLLKQRFLNAVSVGFAPLRAALANEPDRAGDVDILEQELWEWSVVNVPSDPNALAGARSSGIDTHPIVEWCERALELGDKIMPRAALTALRRDAGAPILHSARSGIETRRERAAASKAKAAAIARDAGAGAFGSFAEFLRSVVRAERGEATDARLMRAPAGANEGNPTAGGFLVPEVLTNDLIGSVYEEAVIAPLCDERPTTAPLADVKVPAIDETSRADGSRWGGAVSYWADEAQPATLSFPRFRNIEFVAGKLISVCPASNEFQADAAFGAENIKRAFASEASFKLDLAILSGTGAGLPLGLLNSTALITVAKVAGQAAATVVAENISAMWKRLPAPSRRRAVWLVNEDAEDQLVAMNGAASATGVTYIPAGAAGNADPLLKGRPVLTVEQCPVLGTVGDIVLADLSQYVLVSGPPATALSAHVRFDSDQATWRFVLRVDGKAAWASPVTPYNGSSGNKRSPFIALAAR